MSSITWIVADDNYPGFWEGTSIRGGKEGLERLRTNDISNAQIENQ